MKKGKGWITFIVLISIVLLAACGSESSGTSAESNSSNSKLPEGYPDRNIEMLVGYGAGGGTDLTARHLIEALNSNGIVDQSFTVTNMPGAGGALALRKLATSDNEYTMLAIPGAGDGIWNGAGGGLKMDEFKPIAQVASDYQLICVMADSPYQTLEELFDAIKKDPKSVVVSSASALSGSEAWQWDAIVRDYGISDRVNILALEGGNAALTALLNGDADTTFVVPQLAADHIEKGTIRPLAVTTSERTEEFPDVPSLKEFGIDETAIRSRGFWLDADVSDEVLKYWEDALKQMMDTDLWKEYIKNNGLLADFKGTEEYTEFVIEQGEAYQEYYERVSKE